MKTWFWVVLFLSTQPNESDLVQEISKPYFTEMGCVADMPCMDGRYRVVCALGRLDRAGVFTIEIP